MPHRFAQSVYDAARNDLMADVVPEKYRRAVIGYVQNFGGGSLLQFCQG